MECPHLVRPCQRWRVLRTSVPRLRAYRDGASGGGAVVSHTYAAEGVYTATVTATNGLGRTVGSTVVEVTPPQLALYLPLVLKGGGGR